MHRLVSVVEEDTSASERVGAGKGKGTSLLGASMLLATFSTTSSNIMYPAVYGTLGSALGPILGLLVQGLMCLLSVRVMDVALSTHATTLAELGRALGGRAGERVFGSLQLANNALFLPIALVVASGAMRQIAFSALGCDDDANEGACAWWRCDVHPLLLTCALAWPMLLVARNVAHLEGLASISIALIFAQTGVILAYVFLHDSGDELVAARLIGATLPAQRRWDQLGAALAVYLYSFCPLFIAVEVAASMADPRQIKTALVVAYLGPALCVYVPTGLAGVLVWGAEARNPITAALRPGALCAAANGMLLYCTLLDFLIAATTCNTTCRRALFPSLGEELTLRSLPRWLARHRLATLPALLFALALALFVPKFDSLVGLLTSACVPAVMLVGPASCLLIAAHRQRRSASGKLSPVETLHKLLVGDGRGTLLHRTLRGALSAPLADGVEDQDLLETQRVLADIGAANWPVLLLGVFVGLVLFVWIMAETVYSIIGTDFGGNYWCASIGR